MKKDELRRSLEAKGIGSKGVTNRIYWCTKIEEDYNVNIDNICKSETKIRRLIEEIDANPVYKKAEKKNLISSLNRYAQFINTQMGI